MRLAVPLAFLVASIALGGCFGGEARTEWAFKVTQLTDLEDSGRVGKGVTIAIIDTGINPQHAALKHLFDGNKDNGEVVAFRDFLGSAKDPAHAFDDEGHGSHVAGIIAASGSSLGDKLVYGGVDLLGAAPAANLVVARVCSGATCDTQAIIDAINWAVAQHAEVINLSLGAQAVVSLTPIPVSQQDAFSSAVNNAIAKGVVVVAAAGNDGPNNSDVSTPASLPDVISVGAIQEDGRVWDKSSRGDDAANPCRHVPVVGEQGRCDPNKKPELVAPGVEILSAWKGDQYVRATGTSQATPFVTSVVALMLENRGPLHNRDDVLHLKDVLRSTTALVPGQAGEHDPAAGYGLVQAKAALDAYR